MLKFVGYLHFKLVHPFFNIKVETKGKGKNCEYDFDFLKNGCRFSVNFLNLKRNEVGLFFFFTVNSELARHILAEVITVDFYLSFLFKTLIIMEGIATYMFHYYFITLHNDFYCALNVMGLL
jgi:hypothetical protein